MCYTGRRESNGGWRQRVLVVVVIFFKEGEDNRAGRRANKCPIRKGRGELVVGGGG